MKFDLPTGGSRPETQAERVLREADAVAEGRAEIAAGQGIDDDALEAWLDALDQDESAPLPTAVADRDADESVPASEQMLLSNRVENAFSRVLRTNIRFDEIKNTKAALHAE